MKVKNQFDWVPFYGELAQKLLVYEKDRSELVNKVYRIFDIAKMDVPTLDEDYKFTDIDPFTFFGLFNKTNMREANRIKIIRAIAKELSISSPTPTSFDSIPVLNPLNATYYYFAGYRGKDDINELWQLFKAALNYADDQNSENKGVVSKYFDLTINKKGNGNSKITMGLYWIAPDTFLNLDSRNEWYIYQSGKIPEEVVKSLPKVDRKISSVKYFKISDKIHDYLLSGESELHNFMELSYEAWTYSQEVNDKIKAEKLKHKENEKNVATGDEDIDTVHYWLYSPGRSASHWDEFYKEGIMAIGWEELGDLSTYASKEELTQKLKEYYGEGSTHTNAVLATWQFANELKPNDIVFAKKGRYEIVGRGVVESDYSYDPDRDADRSVRRVNWTNKGHWEHPGQAVMKTLTDITSYKDYVEKLNALFVVDDIDDEDEPEPEISYPPYLKERFLEDVYIDAADYDILVDLVTTKKNLILEGVPGVGKTYAAKRLAYSIMGEMDISRVEMIQFHQSYSYEDFIMGFRPTENGFELRNGVFYNFCKKAEEDSENKYFFIIDEINRGNLSKIFGELFMLIENDKRGNTKLKLLYKNETFSVPSNLYIIGLMNTADRSLAMLDYALRRRFVFYDMKPGFDSAGFKKYQDGLHNLKFDKLIGCVKELNDAISSDETLGENFCIGHSYFCGLDKPGDGASDKALNRIVNYELIPLLKEYWFDEPEKLEEWADNLRRSIQ